ncbi:SAM-dependent methyltransferase [Bacillus massiliigorillae]|uniref:SAM-dependent methyltransferase n=1 Tax=Bacillus massiliigorillae TaxID=1243664 RepID=UPI0003A08FF8|nr:methyltransferase [Bacillus massiliigorillae]
MKEIEYDHLLNIKTTGDQMGFHKSLHYHRYEPTPYAGLKKLLQHLPLTGNDRVVDFGCGKGRLNFFIHHECQASVVGIEMDEGFYEEALANLASYGKKASTDKIQFLCCFAQEYEVNRRDNVFYFFNPFSVQIFRNVINNILLSVERTKREITVVLYYPSEEYLFFLDDHPSFERRGEVGLNERDENERFVLYKLAYI